MLDLVFTVGTGLYLLGGLALVLLGLIVDHAMFRHRVDAQPVEEMLAAGQRAPVFDIEVDDDWAGFA